MADAILSWPECLGTFDEESCRYFLRELGQRIVQFYPFSVGMEEVFTQIVARYGFDGVADAMSVLQELLEDDSAAAGIGDDGDIWRSWRHAWRHRNHDSHDPYVPRVRGRILPPTTSTRIRLLKATNFTLLLQPARLRASSHHTSPLTTVNEHETPKRSIRGLHNDDFKDLSVSSSSRGTSSCLADMDKTSPLIRSTEAQTQSARDLQPHNSHRTGSPRRSMPLPARKHAFPFNIISPKRRSSGGPKESLDENQSCEDATYVARETNSERPSSDSSQQCVNVSEKTPLSQRWIRPDNRYSLPSDLGSVDVDGTPTKKRSVHRQARLIDGALFQGKTRKGEALRESNNKDGLSSEQTTKVSSSFHFQQASRASWLQTILSRFQGKQKHQQPELRKQRSSLGDCGLMSQTSRRIDKYCEEKEYAPCLPQIDQAHKTFNMSLDGAWDEEHNNKPLPLSPFEQSTRPSLQSDTERYMFQQSPDISALESRTLFTSSNFTNNTQQDELRSLVSATMSGPQELSQREKALKYRYSDTSSQSPPVSPKSFTTFANKNPFLPLVELPHQASAHSSFRTQGNDEVTSTIWPFKDAENASTLPTSPRTPQYQNYIRESPRVTRKAQSLSEKATGEAVRGRKPATPPPTPSRPRFGLKGRSPQKTPRPRSRSPVKRLVGMVKSMSTNQIPTVSTPPRTDTSASTKGKKWKELSNKIRNGFLTADLEQLEQEELMDQYVSNSDRDAIRVVTPPSTHDRVVFPVSIKSSGQSKLWSELEYMLIETSNSFIKEEVEHSRIPRESVIRTRRQWQARNRPQVIEFYYDQATQYELIITNLRTIKLYSDYAQDAIMLNSVLHQWKILVRELSVKTLCMPDSIVRRWLHDGRRILELLGASTVTLTNMDKLTTLCMAVIGSAEKERTKQQQTDLKGTHRRSASDGSQVTLFKHEDAFLRGSQTPPPLPTPTSISTGTPQGSRKVTPQELQEHLRRKAPGRAPTEAKQFVFTSGVNACTTGSQNRRSPGHAYSKSHGLTPSEERARFVFD